MYNNSYRPMKRQHSPDFEEQNNSRGPYRGGYHGGHHPFNKRHRGDYGYNQQPQTIEDKIARLGDTGSRNVDIGILAKDIDADLANKVGEEEKIKFITSKICKCVVAFPTRIATYSTLIGLISVKHYNVSCQIINTLHASYPVYLEAQKWREALTIIHLLSSLVNCKVIRPSALLSQFELLLEITAEDNIPQARSDYYVYTVLSSLPYVALELSTQTEAQEAFERTLNTIETYLSKRSKAHLNAIKVWLSDDSTIQMDYLDSLWVQTKNFRANNWNEAFLHRPYNDKDYKDTMASSLIPQNSPTIQIPAHSSEYRYPIPRIVFRVFEDDVTEGNKSIPGLDKIERFCIESYIRNIIDELSDEPRDCARHLSHMYRSDQLPIKHILIETILGELFTLPEPKHPEIFYHSLLYELSKIFHPFKNPEELKFNYDFVLNEAVKVLYDNLDTMNITCFSRFTEWFSFHLNNTEFIFPWQFWSDSTGMEKTSPKALFVQAILDHCVRFSFHKKVSTLVSEFLSDLMPAVVGVKYQPIFADNPKAEELDATIDKLILGKADGKVISEVLNLKIDGVEMPEDFMLREEKHSEKLLKIDIFTAAILTKASKSLTHLSSAIGKYRNVFKALTRVENGQVQLLQTMHSCLESHPQLQVILVDKLLKADLIEAKEVCDWIFSDSMKPHHMKSYPFELLNNTIHRTLQFEKNLIMEKESKSGEGGGDDEENGQADIVMKSEENPELDERIVKARNNTRDLILKVFKMFANRLSKENNVNNWVTGRMQQVYYKHYSSILDLYDEIKTIIDDTPSIGNSIINLGE